MKQDYIDFFKDKRILVTGGTGTFGHGITEFLLNLPIQALIILSRDELKQFNMKTKFSLHCNFKKLRFFIGDIRDRDRISMALHEVDIVFHAAALKRIDTIEYNPMEAIKTNILGTQNMIEESIKNKVKYFMTISTDKAVNPCNLYGGTKFCSEKLTISANNSISGGITKFSVSRYGNVLGSRGSVIHIFNECKNKNKSLKITDTNMTRFNITINEAIIFVIENLVEMSGGEIFVPKLKSYKILDIAKYFSGSDFNKYEITGLREGEKIYEEMISNNESSNAKFLGNKYVILSNNLLVSDKYKNVPDFKGDSYNSYDNEFLTYNEIINLINKVLK